MTTVSGSDSAGVLDHPRAGTIAANDPRFGMLAVAAGALVILADWLFWERPRGWTLGAYGLLLVLVLWLVEWRRATRAAALLTAALLALLGQCAVEPGSLAVGLAVLGLFTLGLVLRDGWSARASEWFRRWALLGLSGWQTAPRDLVAWNRACRAADPRMCPGARILRQWSGPALLALVFLVLFAVANPLISRWLAEAWHALREWLRQFADQFPTAGRMLMWLLTGLSLWALLRFVSATAARPPPAELRTVAGVHAGPAFIVRCLALFNALFALQTVLDLRYLWGGSALPAGLTFAQYAHRGAYPLVAAALLAAVFVLVTFRAGSHAPAMRWARRLVYLWLAQNLLLVVSAAWRLRLYVDAYSLTRLRVAAALWMLLLLCGLAWILVRILFRRFNAWLVNVNTATALMLLYAAAFVNWDGAIAQFNVAHCRELGGHGPPIDVRYLEHLGPEALPAVAQLAGASADRATRGKAQEAFTRLRADLQAQLASWHGWTWRRQDLARLAPPVRDSGAQSAAWLAPSR